MKRIVITVWLINSFLSGYSQHKDREQERREFDITAQFETRWEYFRMKRNPLLSYEETHDGANWRTPFLIPQKFYTGHYRPDIKISDWGKSKWDDPNQYVDLRSSNFYLVEKKDGLTGIKRALMTDSILDIMHLNIYDSIFPHDNRFLVVNKRKNVMVYNGIDYTFHSGNVEWGEWRDVGYMKDVAYCGYIRGVQFEIENVMVFSSGIFRQNQGFPSRVSELCLYRKPLSFIID